MQLGKVTGARDVAGGASVAPLVAGEVASVEAGAVATKGGGAGAAALGSVDSVEPGAGAYRTY